MATVVEDLLKKSPVSTVATPAATGTGVMTAPPAVAAPVAAAPAVDPGSAVGKAINMQGAIMGAANDQMKTDPMMSGAVDALVRQRGFMDQAGAEMDARTAKIAAIQAEGDPERIVVPRMKALPPIPTLEDVAKERGVKPEDMNNPMRVFGQMMPLLVAFGALATQRPGINALNAATAAMTAVKQGDKDAYDKSHKEWLENTKLATDTNNQMIMEYKLALDDRNTTMAEKQAKIAQIAATHNDPLAKAALEKGYIDQFIQLQRMREGITTPLINLTQLTMTEAQNKREMEFRSALEWAKIEADRNPAFISTDKVVGTILRKMAIDPAAVTDGDKAALAEAYKQRKASQPMFGGLGGLPGTDGEAPLPDPAGPAAPAPGTAAPKPAASPTAPPVGMLKEGVIKELDPQNGTPVQRWRLKNGKPEFVGYMPPK